MSKEAKSLPDNLPDCHKLINQLLEQMQGMHGQLQVLLGKRYGRKSETISADQLRLFSNLCEEQQLDEEEHSVPVLVPKTPGHGRRRPAKELERETKTYDVAVEELICPGCNCERQIIGKEVSEQYDYCPSSIRVIEHVRLKRGCEVCSDGVVVAPKPPAVIEKGLATPEMLAFICTSKVADHLPLHRLEGIFKRDGATIARSTMCDWMLAVSRILTPLYEHMKRKILRSRVIWTDDTPVLMQDRSVEKNMRTARAWVYLGDTENPYTIFDFTKSRKRDGPKTFLEGFNGFLQADAFAGYDCIYATTGVLEVACFAHARRKFFEAQGTNKQASLEALSMIRDLYDVEREASQVDFHERKRLREEKSVPILDQLENWLANQKLIALPKSQLGKAVTYAMNNWRALRIFTTDGALTIDNNCSERALRALAVGRKNWLFMGSERGGNSSAILSSFIATCKRHEVHPRKYLADVLTRLTAGETDLDSLLPGTWLPATQN